MICFDQVTLALEPMFKRSVTFQKRDDSDLAERAVAFSSEHEYGDIFWYPGKGQAIYKIDDRVTINVASDGVNDFIGLRRPTPRLEMPAARLTAGTCTANHTCMQSIHRRIYKWNWHDLCASNSNSKCS